jgi:tetratricopeptide (TPR) repeat protein
MTSDAPPSIGPERPTRSAALALARLHLRTGALALARTELETLAGRDLLDDPGILDLAEVRWRTGDVAGAGEAVAALLGDAGDAADLEAEAGSALTWIIAAEAAAGRGRPTEARRYAERLRSETSASIDAIFAGLPRSSAWPPDPLTMVPTSATLFPTASDGRPDGGPEGPAAGTLADGGRDRGGRDADETRPVAAGIAVAGAPGLWDALPDGPLEDDADLDAQPEIDPELAAVAEAIAATEALADLQRPAEPHQAPSAASTGATTVQDGDVIDGDEDDDADDSDDADARDALAAGTLAIDHGDPATAAMHLGLALRLAPALAPAVLDALGDRDARELAFVRGDAYRLLGREREARRAYQQARPPTPTPSVDPAVDDPQPAGPHEPADDHDPPQGDRA